MTPHSLISILLATMAPVFAATLPYQGILTDDKGVPVADGPKEISFAVYGQSTGGTPLWSEPRVATTCKGLFSLALGTASPLPDSLFTRDSLFLGVTVSGTELSPRALLGATPWAFRARKADTAKYALNVQGLGAKLDTAALRSKLTAYATNAELTYALGMKLDSAEFTSRLNSRLASYATNAEMTYMFSSKLDTAALRSKLTAYATNAELTYMLGTKVDSAALPSKLASYAKLTDLASYAKTADLSSYAKNTSLANYATTAALNSKMSTADYVASGHIKALGGLIGGRGYDGSFDGSEIILDTTKLQFGSAATTAVLSPKMLIWRDGYDDWQISATPGGTFSLITSNRASQSSVLIITKSGSAQFTGDVNIDGALRLKTAALIFPDYVFEPGYKLAPLSEVEAFTQANKHLPEIPSAAEIEKGGIDLAKMNLLLLKKVEELTLHAIAQEKRIKALEERLK